MSIMASDPETDEIRRRMSLIRRDMHVNIKTAVQSAERLFDWTAYVKSHPWIAITLAAGAGFLAVPGRRQAVAEPLPPSPQLSPSPPFTMAAPVAMEQAVSAPRPAPAKSYSRGEWVGLALGILGPVAVRVAQNYSISAIERWIESQLDASRGERPREPRETLHDEPRAGMAGRARDPRPY